MALMEWIAPSPGPELRGERLMLRLPARSDYEAWRALRDRSRAFLTPWEPVWGEDELSLAAYRSRLVRYRQDARERSGLAFFIFDARTHMLYGGITLGQIRRGVSQTGVLGYWMGQPFAGQGVMAEAVRMVCAHAFQREGLHRVEAACLPRNDRSVALLRKSGFVREGLLRKYLRIAGIWEDHDLYALLAEDWSASAVRTSMPPHARGDEQEVQPAANA